MELQALLAATAIALLSLLGVFFFGRSGYVTGTNRFMIPLAIGVFLGVVFFELIPETLEMANEAGSIPIVLGFIGFYLLSQVLRTYHHHHDSREHHDGCENKAGATMLLAGDAVHNVADGIVIATAFLINPAAGVAATIGVALHEIPQEIVEFGVLLHAGYSKGKAALYNLISASSVIAGVMLTFVFVEKAGEYIWILTGLAAGNLLYIAASDLLPNLHTHEHGQGHRGLSFLMMLVGLIGITFLLGATH